MDLDYFIDELIDRISFIYANNQEFFEFGAQTKNAILASKRRALLQEKGLSLAAKVSIASAGLRFVATVIDGMNSSPTDELRHVYKSCTQLLPPFNPDHVEPLCSLQELPEGWRGGDKGPFKKKIAGILACIVRRPLLPGGDWTLCVNGVPFVFDADPVRLAKRAEKLLPSLN